MCDICSALSGGSTSTAATGEKPSWTLEQIVAQLARWNIAWSTDAPVGYTFLTGSANHPNFVALTEAQRQAARDAFEAVADVTSLVFVEKPDDGDYAGEITFGNDGRSTPGVWGYAGPSSSWDADSGMWRATSAVVWVVGDGTTWGADWSVGTYNLTAMLHEILHALGIPHPGDYNAGGDQQLSYGQNAEYEQDSRQFTVMSYWDAGNTGGNHQGRFGATPLLHDIAVLQALYGVNTTTRAGDTVYGFNSTAGRDVFDFSVTRRPVAAIWDAGGVDEIDVSGFAMGNLVDLRAGYFSSVGGLVGNLAVAYGAVIENATGGAGVDTLIGNDVANRLNGGGGADIMRGGLGDDVYIVDHEGDRVEELADHGNDSVVSTIGFSLAGSQIETLVLTGSAHIDATGNSLDNRLVGNAGVNILTGGAGDDVYVVQNAADLVIERAGEGVDTVESSVAFILGDHVENLTLTGSRDIDGFGNALANVLVGNSGRNILRGAAGDDTYFIQAGDQVIEMAGEGLDTVHSTVTYALGANVENLTLVGGAAIDGVGNDLNNVLIGNAGVNVLSGGRGDDTYHVQNAQDRVVELSGQGRDRIVSTVSFSLAGIYVEDLALVGPEAMDATGNSLANRLTGNAGANRLDGGAGDDTLEGGLGDDIYIVDSRADRIVERADEGIDTVFSSVDLNLGATHADNLTLTGAAKYGTGNALNNVLTGNASANVLRGGQGDDTYVIQGKQDRVVEANGEGTDTVISSGDFSLAGIYVENLTLAGSAKYGTGNSLNNILTGNAAVNVLSGGRGDDTYVIQGKQDRVVEKAGEGTDTVVSSGDFSLAGSHIENLTLTGTAKYGTGNAFANILVGNAAVNALSGGMGDDTYHVQTVGDRVIEKTGEGDDHVYASIDFSLAGQFVERLTLVGAGSLAGTGNSLANVITGNDGANRLDGGAAADRLVGGRGDDTYVIDDAGDVIVELAGEGIDTVESSRTYSLASLLAVEDLFLTGSDDVDGTGNDLDNRLFGNAGVNVLAGGKGNDTYLVQTLGDRVIEKASEGRDLVRALVSFDLAGVYVEDITLEGVDDLNAFGNSLDNVLTGNAGANIMSGRRGNDTYHVQTVGDRVLEAADEGDDHVYSSIDFSLVGQYIERLTLVGEGHTGGTGNSLANRITGNGGNNRLDGGGGADTLIGGLGDDVYVVDHARDRVVESSGQGHDRIEASVSYGLAGIHAEDLWLVGAGSIDGTGNSLDNRIQGNAGANVLSGAGGQDYLLGGAGRDSLRGGDGRDIIYGDATDYTGIGDQLGHAADTLEGGDGDDLLVGGYGDDILSGGAGSDILIGDQASAASLTDTGFNYYYWIGGGGADVFDGGEGWDTAALAYWDQTVAISLDLSDPDRVAIIYRDGQAFGSVTGVETVSFFGGGGADRVTGGVGWSSLSGYGGDDILRGGSGGSSLVGHEGADTLIAGRGSTYFYGGAGQDRFVFEAGSAIDGAIDDYEAGELIDLSGMDADATVAGDQAFRLVDAFTGKADEIVLDINDQRVVLRFDLDGNGSVDQVLTVSTPNRDVDLVL